MAQTIVSHTMFCVQHLRGRSFHPRCSVSGTSVAGVSARGVLCAWVPRACKVSSIASDPIRHLESDRICGRFPYVHFSALYAVFIFRMSIIRHRMPFFDFVHCPSMVCRLSPWILCIVPTVSRRFSFSFTQSQIHTKKYLLWTICTEKFVYVKIFLYLCSTIWVHDT